jgi:hypothetical protein
MAQKERQWLSEVMPMNSFSPFRIRGEINESGCG